MSRRAEAAGTGPRTVLRALSVVTTPTATPEVRELAYLDIAVGDDGRPAPMGSPVAARYSTLADDPGCGLPACTPVHVAQAMWRPSKPNVLVVHDLAAVEEVAPRPISRAIPVIDVGRVARAVWSWAPVTDLYELVAWRGRRAEAEAAPGWAGLPRAAREVLLIAMLLRDLAADPGLAALPSPVLGRDAQWLGRVLGGLLGEPSLQHAIDATADGVEPLGAAPGPWDHDEAWHVVPTADVEWHAWNGRSDWVQEAADAELARRRAASGGRGRAPSRVLLRRGSGPAAPAPPEGEVR